MSETLKNKAVLEWTYTPSNYFEDVFRPEIAGVVIELHEGKAKAVLDRAKYERDETLADVIDARLRDLFAGVEVVTHKSFDLSEYVVTKYREDGSAELHIRAHSGVVVFEGSVADIKTLGPHGEVIKDTRADRINEKRRLGALAEKFLSTDPLARFIFHSYHLAVQYPNRELVYLTEVCEALVTHIGGKQRSKLSKILHMDLNEIKELSDLANRVPLRQGRHAGEHAMALRDATPAELDQARRIARTLITRYLDYLESEHLSSPGSFNENRWP